MDLGLSGKTAIVTGGGNGIGKAICIGLAREKVKVIVTDLNEKAASNVALEIEKNGGQASFSFIDVTNVESIKEVVRISLNKLRRIDILVNSAGIISIADVVRLTETDWDRVIDVNAKGVFLCCKIILPHMITQKYGKIVNISSQAGPTGFPYEAHYSASKAAVIAFSQALAREIAQYKINVNSVCPGSIETELNKIVNDETARLLGILPMEKYQKTIERTPLGRKGTPEDVANMVTFLVSDKLNFMTGQAINITGGRELH